MAGNYWSTMVRIAMLTSAPVLIGATSMTGNFESRILGAHNRERQAMGVDPLNWNADLATSAHRWAVHLAATGEFEHAPESHTDPEGENLWAGSRGDFTLEGMVDGWVEEKRNFRPGIFGQQQDGASRGCRTLYATCLGEDPPGGLRAGDRCSGGYLGLPL